METHVYTFHISCEGMKDLVWRKIEVSSNYRMDQLGYLVLSAFDTKECRVFEFLCDGVRFSIPIGLDARCPLDMTVFRLGQLNLQQGAQLHMEYDFGERHIFMLELIGCRPMVRGQGKRYPTVIDGAGGCVEVAPAFTQGEQPPSADEPTPAVRRIFSGDYCLFDMQAVNASLKYDIDKIEEHYAKRVFVR